MLFYCYKADTWPLSCFLVHVDYFFSLLDGYLRELPDHVGHHFQSITPTTACNKDQDWLEQDIKLQNWKWTKKCINESTKRLIQWLTWWITLSDQRAHNFVYSLLQNPRKILDGHLLCIWSLKWSEKGIEDWCKIQLVIGYAD